MLPGLKYYQQKKIIKDIEDGTFTPTNDDFNKFITLITITVRKSDALLTELRYNTDLMKITGYMFKNFVPNEKQVEQLISCYKSGMSHHINVYIWIDQLVDKKHIFTDKQIKMINSIGYPNMNKILGNSITIETLKYYKNLMIRYHTYSLRISDNEFFDLDEEIEKIKNFNGNLPQEYLYELFGYCHSINKFEPLIIAVINKSDMDQSIFSHLIDNKIDNYNIFMSVLKKVKYTNEFIDYLINIPSSLLNLETLLLAVSQGYNVTENTLNSIVSKNTECKVDLTNLNGINLDKINTKLMEIKKNEDMLGKLDKLKIDTTTLFEIFDIAPSIETLRLICKCCCNDGNEDYSNSGRVKYFIKKYKIYPNKMCLDASIQVKDIKLITEILCYKLIPDKETLKNLWPEKIGYYHYSNDNIQKIIELLIKNGLKCDFDDIKLALKNSQYIPQLEIFNIPYDEQLYFQCYKYDNFPDYYNEKFAIDQKILELRTLCRKNNNTPKKIMSSITLNKNIIDQYCIDFLYMSNKHKICNIIESNCNYPTILSIFKTHREYYKLKYITDYFDKTNIEYTDMIKQFNINIV